VGGEANQTGNAKKRKVKETGRKMPSNVKKAHTLIPAKTEGGGLQKGSGGKSLHFGRIRNKREDIKALSQASELTKKMGGAWAHN